MTQNIVFSQITNLISSTKMNGIHRLYGNHKYIKKFSCVDHFKVLIFSQIKGFSSLREIEIGLKTRLKKLFHLGIRSTVKRSTLSDANNKRNPEAFREMFFHLLKQCKSISPKHKFRFKKEFYSLDSTTISLGLKLCEWAKFRRTKSGIKVHTLLNHTGYIPEFISITPAKQHDTCVIQTKFFRNLKPGSILVMDRAYVDFRWLNELTQRSIVFITRAKSNMNFKVIERKSKLKNKGILKDNVIRLKGFYKSKDYPSNIRLIKYKDKESGKVYQYITNDFKLAAKTIAECYKERWQIELFFKWIKQNLKIKKFIGNSEKAIHHQIWAALIYYLIISFIKFKNKWDYSLLHISRVIKELIEESLSLADIFKPPDKKCNHTSQIELFKPLLTGH